MKLYIYATEIDKVLVGDLEWSITASSRDNMTAGDWMLLCEVDVEFDIDREQMTARAMQIIDEQEEAVRDELAGKLSMLERKRSELLAITHQ